MNGKWQRRQRWRSWHTNDHVALSAEVETAAGGAGLGVLRCSTQHSNDQPSQPSERVGQQTCTAQQAQTNNVNTPAGGSMVGCCAVKYCANTLSWPASPPPPPLAAADTTAAAGGSSTSSGLLLSTIGWPSRDHSVFNDEEAAAEAAAAGVAAEAFPLAAANDSDGATAAAAAAVAAGAVAAARDLRFLPSGRQERFEPCQKQEKQETKKVSTQQPQAPSSQHQHAASPRKQKSGVRACGTRKKQVPFGNQTRRQQPKKASSSNDTVSCLTGVCRRIETSWRTGRPPPLLPYPPCCPYCPCCCCRCCCCC